MGIHGTIGLFTPLQRPAMCVHVLSAQRNCTSEMTGSWHSCAPKTAGVPQGVSQPNSSEPSEHSLSFHVYPFGVHVKSCSFYEPKRPIRKMIMNLRTFRFLKTRNRNITSICESRLVLARLRSRNHDQVFRPGRRGPSVYKQTAKSKKKRITTDYVNKIIRTSTQNMF